MNHASSFLVGFKFFDLYLGCLSLCKSCTLHALFSHAFVLMILASLNSFLLYRNKETNVRKLKIRTYDASKFSYAVFDPLEGQGLPNCKTLGKSTSKKVTRAFFFFFYTNLSLSLQSSFAAMTEAFFSAS